MCSERKGVLCHPCSASVPRPSPQHRLRVHCAKCMCSCLPHADLAPDWKLSDPLEVAHHDKTSILVLQSEQSIDNMPAGNLLLTNARHQI